MKAVQSRILRFVLLTITLSLLFIGGAMLFLPKPSQGESVPVLSSPQIHQISVNADHVITPSQMSLSSDVAVCGAPNLHPTVASWCNGVPPGTIMLGIDPGSPNPAQWDGGQATALLNIDQIDLPKFAVISVTWPDRDGKGIHSPLKDQVATVTWDGVPIWTKRTTAISTFGDYYAAEHQAVLATAVITQSGLHHLIFDVPAQTAWDISSITLQFYPMWQELRGIAYSPFRDCQNPHWGPSPTETEIEEDIARLAHMSNGIRTYSALTDTTVGQIPGIAQKYNMPVCVGVWLGREKDADGKPVANNNRQEIDGAIELANTYPNVECVIVGNEVLLRSDLTEDELIGYIREVSSSVQVPVTTAEIGGLLVNHPQIINELDFIMIHTYPSWEKRSIEGAVQRVVDDYLQWRNLYPNKRIVIGETGWPSAGPEYGDAIPSLENQKLFFYEFLAAAEENDIEYYYFSAFDELWKREGGVGSHWGFMYSDRTGKHEIQSVFMPTEVIPLRPSILARGHDSLDLFFYLPLIFKNWPQFFTVYDEYASAENHFAPSGWMGDRDDIDFYECDRSDPYSGDVAARVTYNPQGEAGWAGIYWQEPDNNWGTISEAGYDLDNAYSLQFYARGEHGGERVKFLMGGLWSGDPSLADSQQPALSTDVIVLTNTWRPYTIDLRGKALSQVIGGFAFVTNNCLSAGQPITFYLDKIQYLTVDDPSEPPPARIVQDPDRFDIYRDQDMAGNHYEPSGWMGDLGDIALDTCFREDTHSGSTAIKAVYSAEGNGPSTCQDLNGNPIPCAWSGVYWQNPANNSGDRPGGYDLSGAEAVTFWAKGELGNECVSFKAGGLACEDESKPYPDSLCPARLPNADPILLEKSWQVYTIPLTSTATLTRVMGGFVWSASAAYNPTGATFYLDDIQYLFNVDLPPQPHIIYNGRLGPGYDMGVDSSGHQTDWVQDIGCFIRMNYPPGQQWGAVFITVGMPTDPPRPSQDLSNYRTLSFQLRGQNGGETVWVGLKDSLNPDNGREIKIPVTITSANTWETHSLPLTDFTTADLTKLYVVTEFVFESGTPSETIDFRQIQYLP